MKYDFEDELTLYVDGRKVSNYTRYSFSRGVIEQPSSFSFTIGSGDTARELMRAFRPLMKVELKLADTLLFTGVLEDISSSNAGGATELTLQGRDNLYRLAKNYALCERSFGQATYLDMTKEVLKLAGYPGDVKVSSGNDDNRVALLKTGAKKKPATRKVVEQEQTNLVSGTGAKIVYEKVVSRIGESWFDFLISHYKKAGLYLMCAADGGLILMVPDPNLMPSYALRRFRGLPRDKGTIISHDYQNRTSQRHAQVFCFGKNRPDKNGQFTNGDSSVDWEMTQMGFDANYDILTLHDEDAKSIKERQYVAERHIAESIRRNRTLKYTTAGHTVESLDRPGMFIPWTPDTMVSVNDDELCWPHMRNEYQTVLYGEKTWTDAPGIQEDCYIERVEFNRDARSGTTTTLHLMRWSDMLYIGEDPTIAKSVGENAFHGGG